MVVWSREKRSACQRNSRVQILFNNLIVHSFPSLNCILNKTAFLVFENSCCCCCTFLPLFQSRRETRRICALFYCNKTVSHVSTPGGGGARKLKYIYDWNSHLVEPRYPMNSFFLFFSNVFMFGILSFV